MSEPFSAALLAGGRSRRMGEDKAFMRYGDPPQMLWERQLQLLGSLAPEQLLLSQNADQEFSLPRGVESVVDVLGDSGPLGGLVSCLRKARNRRMLVLAIDLPFVTRDFLESMLESGGGLVLQDPDFGRYEAVAAIYSHECLEIAAARLAAGELAMQGVIEECVGKGLLEVRIVGDDERAVLRNLNRPEDLGGL